MDVEWGRCKCVLKTVIGPTKESLGKVIIYIWMVARKFLCPQTDMVI